MTPFERMVRAVEKTNLERPTSPVSVDGVVYDLDLVRRGEIFPARIPEPRVRKQAGQAARRKQPLRAIDLFAGLGGFSMGAEMAGLKTVWAANHCVQAVLFYQMNHPSVRDPVCQNILSIKPNEWNELVPAHDVMLASPSCKPFTRAGAGRKKSLKDGEDPLRQTPLAAATAALVLRPKYFFMENVPEFARARANQGLYRKTRSILERAGYALSEVVVDAADVGTAITRVRWFLMGHLGGPPMRVSTPNRTPKPASSIIDWSVPWVPLEQSRVRDQKTFRQIRNGMALHKQGARGYSKGFIVPYFGTDRIRGATRPLTRPLGSIRTRGSNGLVRVVRGRPWWRMLTVPERMAAMGFPAKTKLVEEIGYQVQMGFQFTGNAVAPPQGCWVVREGLRSVGAL